MARRFRARAGEAAAWRKALGGLRTRAQAPLKTSETLLDSFDRRLQRAGIELRAHGEEPHVHCRVSGLNGDPSEFELERLPHHAWDFPHATAVELARTLEARGVEPIALHELECDSWAVLGDDEKIVAWIEEARHRVRPPGETDEGRPSLLTLEVRGVRGYGAEFERVTSALERAEGLAPAEESFDPLSLLEPAAPERARWPHVDRRSGAFRALARIAQAQRRAFTDNEGGIRAGTDAEHLHDGRIALRRLRSLIGQLKGVLAPSEEAALGAELRWLTGCLGPARDLDTLLLELRLSAPDLRADLGPVLAQLERERERRYADLRQALDSERCGALRVRLATVFSARTSSIQAGPLATQPFVHVLEKRLRRRLEQVVAAAERLQSQSPTEELHELRIACKKLRYLMECCRGLVQNPALARCFAELKSLQSALGTIQDAHVHCALLTGLADALPSGTAPRALLALGRFQEQVLQRGRGAREHYAELRDAFLSRSSQARFAALLRELSAGVRPP